MVLRNLNVHMEKNETRSSLTLYKIKSKWNNSLNIKPETVKLQKKSGGQALEDMDKGNNFLNRTPLLRKQEQE
jgi:hypothetical protein